MTDYTLSGIHPLRRLMWTLLKSELGWSNTATSGSPPVVHYGGAVPIVTPQQQPELNAGNLPYIVYNYTHQPGDERYWLKEEQATFVIYSGDEEDIRKALNMFGSTASDGGFAGVSCPQTPGVTTGGAVVASAGVG